METNRRDYSITDVASVIAELIKASNGRTDPTLYSALWCVVHELGIRELVDEQNCYFSEV